MSTPWRFWKRFVRRTPDVDAEIGAHLEMDIRARIEAGASAEEARIGAIRQFGNTALVKETTRRQWGWTRAEAFAQDARYALRGLARTPVFTLTAISAMALGIGATTAIFTVVNGVLLKPLPFPEPERLAMVREVNPMGRTNPSVQTQVYLDWRARNRSFTEMAAILRLPSNLAGDGEPEQVRGAAVTASFFQVFQSTALMGRGFSDQEAAVGGPGVAVISHALWQRKFGGSADILGSDIDLNGSRAKVVGVMSPDFLVPGMEWEVIFPYRIDPRTAPRDGRNLLVAALLKPGVSVEMARQDIEGISRQIALERPEMNAKWSATVIAMVDDAVGTARQSLLVLLGAVGFVLLVACVNVANLLLLRGAGRTREVAVRTALGAGRARLAQQFLVESVVLAAAGGAAGFALAHWGVQAILAMLPPEFPLPRTGEIRVDATVLLFALAISLACGLLFGLAPALQAGRKELALALAQGGRSAIGGGARVRAALVVAEIAVALLLVCGAGLMMRSFLNLNRVDPGFRAENVLTFRALLLFSQYGADTAARGRFVEAALQRIRSLPQVSAAGTIHFLPLSGLESGSGYHRADRPAPPPGSPGGGAVSVVSDGYFRAMGISLLAGRDFDSRDTMQTPAVAILNDVAAKHMFPGEDPIGKRLSVGWTRPEAVVIGVVAGNRHDRVGREPARTLFLSNSQQPNLRVSFVVRTTGDPERVMTAIRDQLRAVNPRQGIADVQTMTQLRDNSLANQRLQTMLIGLFGLFALVLASVGIYGVMSYAVSQRTREIGVRLALGADRGRILSGVLAGGMRLAVAGVLIGACFAIALARQLETLLYGVKPFDAATYAGVCGLLLAVAAAACLVPAWRAARIDPAIALREE